MKRFRVRRYSGKVLAAEHEFVADRFSARRGDGMTVIYFYTDEGGGFFSGAQTRTSTFVAIPESQSVIVEEIQ